MFDLARKRFLLDSVKDVKGDFAEFGVFRGDSFITTVAVANEQGKVAYAFDSFIGLAEPQAVDMSPEGPPYPKGKFSVGGPNSLIKRLAGKSLGKDYFIIEGFIPDSLKLAPQDLTLSFAYIDLDHFGPTLDALLFVWDRLSPGGIMLCDDYFPNRKWLATLAIDEWRASINPKVIDQTFDQIGFSKC